MAVHPIDFRYGSKEMRSIWEEEARLQKMLDVEAALALALADLKKIPEKDALEIKKKAHTGFVKLERVKELEAETKHDVMALVKALTEQCGESGKYVHLTATSYDIVDTALALQLRDSLEIILGKGKKLLETVLDFAEKHEKLVMVGRTHGQHAIPITLGFKFANYADKLGMGLDNLVWDKENLVRGKFSGAVGNYAAQKALGIDGGMLEEKVMEKLGLQKADISTQVVARENLARILSDLAIFCCTIEQVANEVRNLQRTEIGELSEGFGEKQVGSSTMAQKKNPINAENICSNVRVIRSVVYPALENIALEHERDLTNSAAERAILPTAFLLADEVIARMTRVVQGLEVSEENIKKNLELTRGGILAEAIITKLVEKGVGRQEAHELLRKSSHEAMREGKNLGKVLEENGVAKKFGKKEFEELLDYENYVGLSAEKTHEIVLKWRKQLRDWSQVGG
jgi:adenylosuccinate lyase